MSDGLGATKEPSEIAPEFFDHYEPVEEIEERDRKNPLQPPTEEELDPDVPF